MKHEKVLEKNARTDDGEEETNGGKRAKNDGGEIRNINKTHFQVASKVEVCTHQVKLRNMLGVDFSLFNLLSFAFPPFSGSAMVRSSSSLCSYCYCINGN